MMSESNRDRVLSLLTHACGDLDDVLVHSASGIGNGSTIVPPALRNEIYVLRADLARIIHRLKGVHDD
jgi:hypothetical protein